MNKDDILEKSRKENRNKDLYEEQVLMDATAISAIAASLLATLFFVVQLLVRDEWNLGLYAVVLCIGAATFIRKAVALKRARDIALAVLFTGAALGLSALHLYKLVTG